MMNPRKELSAFAKQHPRLASVVYQVLLCVGTLWCALAIANYTPAPAVGDPTGGPSNGTVEGTCKLAAEDLWPFEAILPYFFPCHSTTALILACFLYVVGIFKLCYHNRDYFDVFQSLCIFMGFFSTGRNVRWDDVLGSLREFLAINIWTCMAISCIGHPIFRWVAPGVYARYVEAARQRRQEYENKSLQRDVESRPRESASFEFETDQQTPLTWGEFYAVRDGSNEETTLTGRGFSRMRDGAYVEIPERNEQAVSGVEVTREYESEVVHNEASLP